MGLYGATVVSQIANYQVRVTTNKIESQVINMVRINIRVIIRRRIACDDRCLDIYIRVVYIRDVSTKDSSAVIVGSIVSDGDVGEIDPCASNDGKTTTIISLIS